MTDSKYSYHNFPHLHQYSSILTTIFQLIIVFMISEINIINFISNKKKFCFIIF